MIPKKQIEEIRKYLEKSENPLFFFDDDADGLCSYMLLMKKYEKGHGIPIKSGPVLGSEYLRKVEEYSPDLVVVLDKSDISPDFIENVHVPIVWIDHHPLKKRPGVRYYNPLAHHEDPECVTEVCYEIVQQDLLIATAGAISDWRMPKYLTHAKKEYPELFTKSKKVEEQIFNAKIGIIIKKLNLCLKGKAGDIRKRIYSLMKLESLDYLLSNPDSRSRFLNKSIERLEKEYSVLLQKARSKATRSKLLVYTYSGEKNSHTAALSNELTYLYPKKIVIVAREKSGMMKMSLRSLKHKIPKKLEKALEGLNGYGGGHEHACGGAVPVSNFQVFLERLKSSF